MTGIRESVYFRLMGSLLYNEPSAASINMLIDEDLFVELPYAADNPTAAAGQKLLLEWLKSSDPEDLADKAKSDYMKLFIGPGKVLSPPWGSVYLNSERLLFNEETLLVRQFYEKYGMMLKKKHHEPDDHIGIEFEFIAHLAQNGSMDKAREFAMQYVMPWVPLWGSDVQQYAGTGYCRGLALMAMGGVQALCAE